MEQEGDVLASKNTSHLVCLKVFSLHLQETQRTTIAASNCCMLLQRILRQEMTDLKVCYLLWAGEEMCSNSGQSGRRFFLFSLSQLSDEACQARLLE